MPPPRWPLLCLVLSGKAFRENKFRLKNIENNLRQIKSLNTYDKAFQELWHFCVRGGGDPLTMSLEEVASWILRFAQEQPHRAGNAYSGFLLIPGWEFLKFSQYIKQAKRLWNVSGAKYADFWDAARVVEKLKSQKIDLCNVAQVRDRCILVLRLFHMCRSVDLSQALRVKSKCNGQLYWKLKRKGRARPEFESLMSLPDRELSPSFLLQRYVLLTAKIGRPGGPMFLSLTPPYAALTANSVGRVTKKMLS